MRRRCRLHARPPGGAVTLQQKPNGKTREEGTRGGESKEVAGERNTVQHGCLLVVGGAKGEAEPQPCRFRKETTTRRHRKNLQTPHNLLAVSRQCC